MLYSYFILALTLFASPLMLSAEEAPVQIIETKCCGTRDELVLYTNPNCIYCKKVEAYLKETGREIPTKNTQNSNVKAELVSIGGKAQVPCLVINGKALYESDKIIAWLEKHP